MIAPLILAGLVATAPDCALTVRFGSYAMGIDRPAAVRIEGFLERRSDVKGTERRPWGREGEYDLCVRLKPRADAVALFEAMRSLVPAKPVGPIEVRMIDRAYGVNR